MKKKHKRLLASLLAAVMLAGQVATTAMAAAAADVPAGDGVNLARLPGVTATASETEVPSHSAADTIDGDRSDDSRWSSSNDNAGTTERVLTLDLGATHTMKSVKIFWEKTNIKDYVIETSADKSQWAEQVKITNSAEKREVEHQFKAPVDARYIRVRVTKYGPAVGQWYNVSVREFEVYGDEHKEVVIGNLATLSGVTVSASNTENQKYPPEAVIDGNYDNDSRWGSDNDGKGTTERTLTLNLGAERTITNFKIFWEKGNIQDYVIETSTNNKDWVERVSVEGANNVLEPSHDLDTPVQAQYVRLNVTKYGPSVENWFNVGVREFEVNGHMPEGAQKPDSDLVTLPEGTNLALQKGVIASATNVETGTQFTADKARDGNKTSRWATDRNVEEPTITYNLGAKYKVGSVILYWENNHADKWHVETSMDGKTWETRKTCEGKLPMEKAPIQTINLDEPVEARYVRIRIEKYSGSWNNVALYEFEVYQGESEVVVTPFTVADELAKSAAVKDGKVTISNEIPEKYTATWGCNYEQVVGADGTIYTPLVDTNVEITVTVREKDNTNVSGSIKATLTIPGEHRANEGNAKPAVAPELAQWYSSAEQKGKVFTLTAGSRIVTDETMRSVAEELKKDIQDRFGLDLPIVTEAAKAGDIQLKAITKPTTW